jgi:hypothetical protein
LNRPGRGYELHMEQKDVAEFNVVAVYREVRTAQRAVRDLRKSGFPEGAVTLRSRRLSDDGDHRPVPPAVEPGGSRERDEHLAGTVARRSVGLATLEAAAGALVGFLIGWASFGLGDPAMWFLLVVGAVTGTVLGFVQGGIHGAMTEAEKEGDIQVTAQSDDQKQAERAAGVLRQHHPVRVDYYDAQGQIPKGG